MTLGNNASISSADKPHEISVVIPVYQGEQTLPGLVAELERLTTAFRTPAGHIAVVTEVLLVHDNGPDNSARVMHELSETHPWIRPIWLSRNFGQHPATLAGMASSGGDWIVTLDEDGQHDPSFIAGMLDTAIAERATVVYAKPTNEPHHGFLRNAASRTAKRILAASTDQDANKFQSFRLLDGEIGRSVAAYAGSGVYLDIAIGWVARSITTFPVVLRDDSVRPSGYNFRSLTSHFWRMVLSNGTRGLRLVSILGVIFALVGLLIVISLAIIRWTSDADIPAGWPSLMVTILISSGAILFAIGVVAEYIGVSVNMAMGRPLYLIVTDPENSPLQRAPVSTASRLSPDAKGQEEAAVVVEPVRATESDSV